MTNLYPDGSVRLTFFPCPTCNAPQGEYCYEAPNRRGTYHPALAHAERARITRDENLRRRNNNQQGDNNEI